MRFLFAFLLLSFGLVAAENPPSTALDRLVKGNQRYISGKLENPNKDVFRREAVAAGQEPFAVIVTCSDSRVPPETVFDAGLGDVFVVRVAGNVIGPLEIESILYGVDALHAPLVIVLGHSNCGAVKAVMQGGEASRDIPEIAKKIEPALKPIARKEQQGKEPTLDDVIQANVKFVRDQIRAIPLISYLARENKLMVVGGVYNLEDGKVSLLKN